MPRPYHTYFDIQSGLYTEEHLGHIKYSLIINQAPTLRHSLAILYMLWYTIRPPHWGTPQPYQTYFDIQSGLHTEAHLGHIVHTLVYDLASTQRHTSAILFILWYTIRPPDWGTPWPYRTYFGIQSGTPRLYCTYFDIQSGLYNEAHLGHIVHILIYNQTSTLRHASAISDILWYSIRPPHRGSPRPYCTYFGIRSGLHTEAHLGHIVHTLIYSQASRLRHTSAILYILWYTIRPPHRGTPPLYCNTLIHSQASILRHTSAILYILW